MNSKYVSNIYVGTDGKLHKVIGGADTVLPFSSGVDNVKIKFKVDLYMIRNGTKEIYANSSNYGYIIIQNGNVSIEYDSLETTHNNWIQYDDNYWAKVNITIDSIEYLFFL